MGEIDIVAQLFAGVTDGMTEVQDHAQTGVVLILLYHIALDADAFINDIGDVFFKVRFRNHIQNAGVLNAAVFDDLCHAVTEGGIRQGGEQIGVDEHQLRLVECADEIFALRQVYAGLAADRGIHLCEQSGRNLTHAHTAQEGGCRKACHVTDDAAAEGDDEILAGDAGSAQVCIDSRDGVEVFVFLARRNHGGGHSDRELCGKLLQIQRSNVGVRDDMDARRMEFFRHMLGGLSEYARTDIDIRGTDRAL